MLQYARRFIWIAKDVGLKNVLGGYQCTSVLAQWHATSLIQQDNKVQHAASVKLCWQYSFRKFSSLSAIAFETVSEETLESLCEYFEELGELPHSPQDFDVQYAAGVLTVNLGKAGTYVINKQTPNTQLWLSSPVSGPKRYDFVKGQWVYRHDNSVLHELLTRELVEVFGNQVNFSKCMYS